MTIEKEYIQHLLCEMAQRQGEDPYFTYYTLDNEQESHDPHIHVCVSIDDSRWNGKAINGKYKSIASVRLNREEYTADNLEFEHILKGNNFSNKTRKAIADWLNAYDEEFKEYKHWQVSLRDYKKANPVQFKDGKKV